MRPHLIVLATLALAPRSDAAPAAVFRHEGFTALSRGELGNAGQNLFVSARGELKLINWFDLDRDGLPELVINNDHSPYENSDSVIYHQHPVDGFRSLLPTVSNEAGAFERIAWMRSAEKQMQFLPSMGGGRSVIADLDADGRPEIIFANFIHGSTHDHFPLFVYWGTESGYSANRRSDFPSQTAAGVAVADLDGNGRLDLVVANMGKEDDIVAAAAGAALEQAPPVARGAVASRIYWQGEEGFSADRVTDLPTHYAVDVKCGDLDGDGRVDLIFLQGGDWPTVRIFNGHKQGFAAERARELRVTGRGFVDGIAGELAIADLDGDGRQDLAVAAGGAELELLINRGTDPQAWTRMGLPAQTPLSVAASDFDGDGRPDLAVTGFMTEQHKEYRTLAYVYWNGDSGLSAGRHTVLPVSGGTCVRAGDVNGDGWSDLAFANSQDNATFDVPSFVYWGGKDGFAPERRTELASFGAVGIAIGDLNRDRVPDLFIANRNSGRSYQGGPIDSFVWWGNRHRGFNGATLTRIPLQTGYSASAGDLFDEGRAAIAFTENAAVAVARLDAKRGVPEIRRWAMPSRGFTTSLADLDRDGRLDLVVGSIDGQGRNLAILRGTEDGLSPPVFHQPGLPVIASGVADLDRDGRVDLILGGRGGWLFCPVAPDGTPQLAAAQRIVSNYQVQRLTVADLDDDGWPDVVATHYREMTGRSNAIESAIYWNRAGRFRLDDRTPLPTFGAHWVSVADLSGRGALEIVFSNYHAETSRTAGLFIYAPDESGRYSPTRRRVLPAYSSSANFVADLDGDGFQDIAAINHTGPNLTLGLRQKSGVHGVGSLVYWGAADGFDSERRTRVPSHGPHKIVNAEPGDVMRRRPFETYTSPWTDIDLVSGEYDLAISGEFHGGASCGAALQPGDESAWRELEVSSATATEVRFRALITGQPARLRYRLNLGTGGAGTGPIVRSIALRSGAAVPPESSRP